MASQLTFDANTLTLCGQSLTDRVMRSALSVPRLQTRMRSGGEFTLKIYPLWRRLNLALDFSGFAGQVCQSPLKERVP